MNYYKSISLLSISLALFACGGGGSDTSAPIPQATPPPSVNQAPSITAIPDQLVNEKDILTISASANDSDGEITSYLWEHMSGFSVELDDTDSSTVSFKAANVINDQGLTLKLTVSDGQLTASELVNITIVDSDNEKIVLNNLSPYTIANDATTESDHFNIENWGLDYFVSDETYTNTVCYPTPEDCVISEGEVFWWEQTHSTTGDFNGDGFEDLVITGMYSPHTIPLGFMDMPRIYLNDGNGHLVLANDIIKDYETIGRESIYRTEVADYNNDGYDDILSATLGRLERHPDGSQTLYQEEQLLLLSNGNGKLVDSSHLIEGFGDDEFHDAHDLSIGDINGDGHIDFQAANYIGINNGDGSFRRLLWPNELPSVFTWAGGTSSTIADFNNDGFGDLAKFMGDNPLDVAITSDMYIILSNGTEDISQWQPVIIGSGFFGTNSVHLHAGSADLNNDGNTDIVVAQTRKEPYYAGRALDIYMGNGDGTFENTTSTAIDNAPRSDLKVIEEHGTIGDGEGSVLLRDFNNDGYIDILDLTSGEASIGIFLNDGTGKFAAVLNDSLPYIAPNGVIGFDSSWVGDKNTTNYAPINLDNKHGLDFITTTHIYWDQTPKPTKFELVYYELKSKKLINSNVE